MMTDRQRVRQCDIEVMKMAMLKHEETFRQQVHELHRLYRIQRELMMTTSDDLTGAKPVTTPRRRSKQPRRALPLGLQLPADEYIASADEDEDAAAGTELELTLAVGGRCSPAGRRKSDRRRRRQAAEPRDDAGAVSSPFGPDCSGASVLSSPSSAEYCSDDGPAAAFHVPPPPCQRAVAFDLEESMMMRQHAPWLLQCRQYLTLRMT
ncbi:uncharacterized protein LOC100276115 [Zea mays]|uniref:Uncharacterized protein n=2 Tax=Zea mays TaxID=4577 RepID=B4FGZ6_MAIZE|nr:uncharacterized protein LOC100276115 [Zea mays]ACF81389.2 unknown [Zea mays]ONM32825.1 hypothetical protein ZEAMMB73_Zm00001d041330 [Zea mays]|eukprot:NP_001132519.2 uncharacterized protein LOC100276115 [Zea mays]